MKVKKKKRNNLVIAIIIIVFAVAAVLCFYNINNKYYSSIQAKQKKAQVEGSNLYELDGPNEKCKSAFDNLGLSISAHAENVQLKTDEDYENYQKTNKKFDISCAPDEDTFNKSGVSGDVFPVTISNSNVGTFNCNKNSTTNNRQKQLFVIQSGKTVVLKNAYEFTTTDGTKCPAGSVSMTYSDVSQLQGDSNIETVGNVSEAYDEDIGDTVYLDGEMNLPNHTNPTIEAFKDKDDEEYIKSGINVVPDGKDYEIVNSLGKNFKNYLDEFEAAPTSKKRTVTVPEKTKTVSETFNLNCNYKLDRNDIDQIEKYNRQSLLDSSGKITNYYYDSSNTSYYKGIWTKQEKKNIRYYYHNNPETNGGATKFHHEDKTLICTITCTEVVKVEYGPPIQVGGGMCFEYRVKVSSIVNCTSQKNGNSAAPTKKKYCSLYPWCAHSHQAGPSEDYETCVKKCDNGEYSKYCSDKCYKEIYENTKSLDLVQNSVFSDMKYSVPIEKFVYNKRNGNDVEERTDIKGCIRGQHYYNTSTKAFDWCPAVNTKNRAIITNNKNGKNSTRRAVRTGLLGIWYYIQNYKTIWHNHKYSSDAMGLGIIRAQYKNGKQCKESCGWYKSKSCKNGYYYSFNNKVSNKIYGNGKCSKIWTYEWNDTKKEYNPTPVPKDVCDQRDLIKYDYINNNKRYYDLIKQECTGKASCTTSTAKFTISFKYKKAAAGSTVTKVDFPFDTKEDALNSQEDGKPVYNTNPGTLIRFGGCYVNADNKKWYLAEWTFPGTWLSNKSGDPVYGKPANENQYVFAKGKVCVPYGLANTNAKWAENYIKYQKADSGEPTGWEFDDKSGYDLDTQNGYNIQAKTTSFGYFHWNFKINCFYALTNGGHGVDPECITGSKKCTDSDFIIRSFDSKDPFLQTAQASSRIQYKVDRPIGFNWTSDATLKCTNPNKKYCFSDGYDRDPTKLIESITSMVDTYSEDNLDYKVHLNKDALQKVRNRNKEAGKYSVLISNETVENRFAAGNGVSHYHSKLLTDLGITDIDECNGRKLCGKTGGNE